MDLYWLSLTFPKHKTLNRRWQGIFTNGFSMDLALSISERQLHTAKKSKVTLIYLSINS